jgi:hypothetical protein
MKSMTRTRRKAGARTKTAAETKIRAVVTATVGGIAAKFDLGTNGGPGTKTRPALKMISLSILRLIASLRTS